MYEGQKIQQIELTRLINIIYKKSSDSQRRQLILLFWKLLRFGVSSRSRGLLLVSSVCVLPVADHRQPCSSVFSLHDTRFQRNNSSRISRIQRCTASLTNQSNKYPTIQ